MYFKMTLTGFSTSLQVHVAVHVWFLNLSKINIEISCICYLLLFNFLLFSGWDSKIYWYYNTKHCFVFFFFIPKQSKPCMLVMHDYITEKEFFSTDEMTLNMQSHEIAIKYIIIDTCSNFNFFSNVSIHLSIQRCLKKKRILSVTW